MHAFLLPLLIACGGGDLQSQEAPNKDFEEPTDEDSPEIVHEPIADAQPAGTPVSITAEVTDTGVGVFVVELYYKNETGGEDAWRNVLMSSSDGVVYTGAIPGDAADNSAGVFYYLKAVDKNDNSSVEPSRGAEDPYHFRVYP